MHILFKIILRILKLIIINLNKILIPIFVKYKMLNALSLLLIFNLNKINKIKPKFKFKYRAIVLSKSGGIDDLISSQKKYNKRILYLDCPRVFFKNIYKEIFKLRNEKKENLNDVYTNFLINLLIVLKKRYNFNIFIGFNFNYFAEISLHKACTKLKIPFLLLYKESVLTELEKKYFIYTLKKEKEKFHGYKIAVYSNAAKLAFIKSKFINSSKISVVGCSRLNQSFNLKNKHPKKQIIYYAIQKDRGLPTRFLKEFGRKYFKSLKDYKSYDFKFNWKYLHTRTLKVLKKFAIKNPNIPIIIKIKTGNDSQYSSVELNNLPKNVQIKKNGAGHEFLKNSKIVIAWNTTSLLEAIAANRFLLLPYFHKDKKFKKNYELNLKLKKNNYGYSENDFYNKLNLYIDKKYNKNNIFNNQYALKYYAGNHDNKADLRLNNFIVDNLIIK